MGGKHDAWPASLEIWMISRNWPRRIEVFIYFEGTATPKNLQAVIVEKDIGVRSTLKGPEVPLTSYCSVGILAD
jgi:hypothetical protein